MFFPRDNLLDLVTVPHDCDIFDIIIWDAFAAFNEVPSVFLL